MSLVYDYRPGAERVINQLCRTTALGLLILSGHSSWAQELSGSNLEKFAVDGLSLQGKVVISSAVYAQYNCSASDQFREFTYCKRVKTEARSGQNVTTTTTILHASDGSVAYVNQFLEPLLIQREQVSKEIERLSAKYGQQARKLEIHRASAIPEALIATWGSLQLTPLLDSDLAILRNNGSVSRGVLVDYLGDYARSANAGLPIFSVQGGAGMVWAASFDEMGRGRLRFFAINAARLSSARLQPDRPAPRAEVARVVETPGNPTDKRSSDKQHTAEALELLKLTIECSQPPEMIQTKDGMTKQLLSQYRDSSDSEQLSYRISTKGISDPTSSKIDVTERWMELKIDWSQIDSVAVVKNAVDLKCNATIKCVKWTVQVYGEHATTMQRDNWNIRTCSGESAENMLVAIQTLIAHAKR